MITLTNPIKVSNSIGGTTTVNYDVLRIVASTSDPVTQSINSQVQIRSSANASAPLFFGSLNIQTQGNPSAVLNVPDLAINIPINISAAISTIQGWITALQNNIETGLVNTGAVTGTQSTGI